MIRVELPHHLRTLAGVSGEVELGLTGPATPRAVLDALEARYPVLRGTIRNHGTLFVGGPKHQGGTLIIRIGAVADE